jgi:hypothetical protein
MGFRFRIAFFPQFLGRDDGILHPGRQFFSPRQPATSCARKPQVANRDGISQQDTTHTPTPTHTTRPPSSERGYQEHGDRDSARVSHMSIPPLSCFFCHRIPR